MLQICMPGPGKRFRPTMSLRCAATWLSAVACVSACSTTTYESYRPVQNTSADIVYVGSTADFGKYRRLMAEEMGIFYPKTAPPSEADLERTRNAFRSAFLEQLAGYEIVGEPANDVMKVKASLVDLRHASAVDVPDLAADLNRILEPGKLTFLVEMRDSVTDDLLLRAADTENKNQENRKTKRPRVASGSATRAKH